MSITTDELSTRYPHLFHMATYGAWPSIQKYGLLSSLDLTNLFQISDENKQAILTDQRKESVVIRHPIHGTATLRDQKPLSRKSLGRCLTGCTPEAWYCILNERVFFWLSRDRLKTLMSAGEYAGRMHTVLKLDTKSLLARHGANVELAHMNTGNTRPFAHPRGPSTFRSLSEYPYEARKRLADYSAIVELTVRGGVPDIRDFVIRAEHATERNGSYEVEEVLFHR